MELLKQLLSDESLGDRVVTWRSCALMLETAFGTEKELSWLTWRNNTTHVLWCMSMIDYVVPVSECIRSRIIPKMIPMWTKRDENRECCLISLSDLKWSEMIFPHQKISLMLQLRIPGRGSVKQKKKFVNYNHPAKLKRSQLYLQNLGVCQSSHASSHSHCMHGSYLSWNQQNAEVITIGVMVWSISSVGRDSNQIGNYFCTKYYLEKSW